MIYLSELLAIFLINLQPWWFIITISLFVIFVGFIVWVVVKFYKRKKEADKKDKEIHNG
ncbi:MAG: hypothetical protein ACLFQO_20055 [Cyclobacteriaceae bacterium]